MKRLATYSVNSEIQQILIQTINGRMYDPVIGRVLSPDNYVQDPTNTQSYNRYSYCLNNPLRYTDPSGWFAAAADQYWNMGKDITDFISFSGMRASSANGTSGSGGYNYNANTGEYTNQYGDHVSFDEVLANYLGPTCQRETLMFCGPPSNPYEHFIGSRVENFSSMPVHENTPQKENNSAVPDISQIGNFYMYNLVITNLDMKPLRHGGDILKLKLPKTKFFSLSLNATSKGQLGVEGGFNIFGSSYSKSLYYSFLDDFWESKSNNSLPGPYKRDDDIWITINNLSINLSETFKFSSDVMMMQYKYIMNGIRQIKYPQEKYGFNVVN